MQKKNATESRRSILSAEERKALLQEWRREISSTPNGKYVLKSPEMELAEKLGISIEEAEKHAAKMGF